MKQIYKIRNIANVVQKQYCATKPWNRSILIMSGLTLCQRRKVASEASLVAIVLPTMQSYQCQPAELLSTFKVYSKTELLYSKH